MRQKSLSGRRRTWDEVIDVIIHKDADIIVKHPQEKIVRRQVLVNWLDIAFDKNIPDIF